MREMNGTGIRIECSPVVNNCNIVLQANEITVIPQRRDSRAVCWFVGPRKYL